MSMVVQFINLDLSSANVFYVSAFLMAFMTCNRSMRNLIACHGQQKCEADPNHFICGTCSPRKANRRKEARALESAEASDSADSSARALTWLDCKRNVPKLKGLPIVYTESYSFIWEHFVRPVTE
jgi:hypothetical protein